MNIRNIIKLAAIEFRDAKMVLCRDFGITKGITVKQAKMVINTEPVREKAQKFENYISKSKKLDRLIIDHNLDSQFIYELMREIPVVEISPYIDFDLKRRVPDLFEMDYPIKTWKNHRHLEVEIVNVAKRWKDVSGELNTIYGVKVIENIELEELEDLKKRETNPHHIEKIDTAINLISETSETMEYLIQKGVEISLIHQTFNQYSS